MFLFILLLNIVYCRTNPHLHRRVVSKEHNYNWDDSYVLNNKSSKIIKSSRSNIRILNDGSIEEVSDLLVPSGVDGVATAYNDEAIGVYINFTNNPDITGSLWTPIIKGNYLCGGGKSKMNYTFSSELNFLQDKEVDVKGVFCVIGVALVICIVVTVTWPLMLSMNKMIMSLLGSAVSQANMQIRQTDIILENLNADKVDENDELYIEAEKIERDYKKIKNSFLNKFKFIWLGIGGCFIALLSVVLAHMMLVQLGLPSFYKLVKMNKCYYIDQSNLVKANDPSAATFGRNALGSKNVAVGKYVGSGKFKCKRGRCVKAVGNDYNMKILGLNDEIKDIKDDDKKILEKEDFKHVEITKEDEENATGTPTLKEDDDDGAMIFTTPCGTTWRNVMDGIRWVMKSPNIDICTPEESTIISHEFVYRRSKCSGGKWSYQNGDWDRPNPTRAGGDVNLGKEVSDDIFSLFSCGLFSLGAKHAGGRIWYETIHRDDWVYCYIKKTGTVGFQRETMNGLANTIAPRYDIEGYTDVREQRPYGWYEDGNYVYAIPEDFNHGEKWSISSGNYSSIEYATEKINKQYKWESGNWKKKYDLKQWDTAVDDFTCSVTFKLYNADQFEEFQDPCPDVEAVMYKDGRIQLKTKQKRTCKLQVRFANNDNFITMYSINVGSPVTIPQGATEWRCTTQQHEEDNVTLYNTGTGCTIDEKTKFDKFIPRGYDGTFQTTVEYSEAPDPGITDLNDVTKKIGSLAKNILGGFDSIIEIVKIVGIILACVILVAVIGSIIFCLVHPKEAVELTHTITDSAGQAIQAASMASGMPPV